MELVTTFMIPGLRSLSCDMEAVKPEQVVRSRSLAEHAVQTLSSSPLWASYGYYTSPTVACCPTADQKLPIKSTGTYKTCEVSELVHRPCFGIIMQILLPPPFSPSLLPSLSGDGKSFLSKLVPQFDKDSKISPSKLFRKKS